MHLRKQKYAASTCWVRKLGEIRYRQAKDYHTHVLSKLEYSLMVLQESIVQSDLMPHKPMCSKIEMQTFSKRTTSFTSIECTGTHSVLATKVLYKDASESGATAHTRTPILDTPAENTQRLGQKRCNTYLIEGNKYWTYLPPHRTRMGRK